MYDKVDTATYTWFCNARSHKLPVNGPMIQTKALQLANTLDPTNKFTASDGWLDKFTKRHEIKFKSLSGEGASVNEAQVNDWLKNLDDICANYDLKDIYNVDETGLMYATRPKKSYVESNDNCLGTRQSKKRLTICLLTNAIGEKERPVVIGNAKRPRAFGRLDVENMYGIVWRHNKTSWMTAVLFEELLKDFNRKMRLQQRKVLLFLDNATCHPSINLSNVELIFLPPNTTSACQPLDQGIIEAFKLNYRKLLLQSLVSQLDEHMSADIINSNMNFNPSMLDVVNWLSEAWKNVKPETIGNFFRRCGFPGASSTAEEEPIVEVDFGGLLSAEDGLAFVNFDNTEGLTINFLLESILMIYNYVHIVTETSEPDRGFSEWENGYIEYIENGGDIFEFENEESSEPVQPEKDANNNAKKKIDEQLKTLQELNEFALKEGKRDLFISTQQSIREIQRMKCDDSTLVQPPITKFFNHT